LEEEEETELVADERRENMGWKKVVWADLTKRERALSRAAEDQIGASGPRSETT